MDDHWPGAGTQIHRLTGDKRYYVDPHVAMLPVDALGFRRSADALKTLLQENDSPIDPLFAQAKLRGIKALSGHAESIDVTNDVNGGPSGVGVATSAGKAAFWDMAGAPRCAQGYGAGRRIRHDRRPCAGTQDPGAWRFKSASGCASSCRTTMPALTTCCWAGWWTTSFTAIGSSTNGHLMAGMSWPG